MNKNRWNIIVFIGVVFIGVTSFNYYNKRKINLEKAEIDNGWYQYKNENIEFEYPGELRNCFECSPTTGNIYTILTDGHYVINYMFNQNSSYLVNPERQIVDYENGVATKLRNNISSFLGIDSTVLDSFHIRSIELDPEDLSMNYLLYVNGDLISLKIEEENIKSLNFFPYKYFSLEEKENYLEKYKFDMYFGRYSIKNEKGDFFIEIEKIKRDIIYLPKDGTISKKGLFRFFESIKFKNTN